MKNINLSFLTVVGLVLVSCGTSTYTSNSNGGYVNSIYYTADAGAASSQQTRVTDVKALQDRTTSYTRNRVDTIYVGEANIVNIDYNPNVDYAVIDDYDSYEARLRKFDSPSYTINIEIDPWDFAWCNPFYANHGWYRPYGITWGTGWYNPYWGWYYSWRPGWGWSIGWGLDWWYGYHWSWGGWYEPYWHNPWHHGWWDGPRPPRRNIYYGRRDAIGTRRDNRLVGGSPRGSVNTGSRNIVGTRNAVGSTSRRTAPSQIRGEGNRLSTRNSNAGSNAGNTRFNTTPSGSSTRNVAPGSTAPGNNRNVAPRNGRPASSTRSGLSSDNRAVYNNNASSRGYNSSTTPSTSRSTATGTSRNAPSGNLYRPAPSSTRNSSGSSVNRGNTNTSTSSPAVGVRHSTGSSVRNSSSSSSRSSGSSYTPRNSSGSSSSRSTGGGGGSSSRSTGGSSTRR